MSQPQCPACHGTGKVPNQDCAWMKLCNLCSGTGRAPIIATVAHIERMDLGHATDRRCMCGERVSRSCSCCGESSKGTITKCPHCGRQYSFDELLALPHLAEKVR